MNEKSVRPFGVKDQLGYVFGDTVSYTHLDVYKRQAHYYVPDEVKKIADYIGDSYYLSKAAQKTDADIIVFCGVKFMGESADVYKRQV